ncbi:MAG: acetyl-CoA carboxylase biotin carboxylase subunit [Chloroflexota bacterium]
MFRKLLIANRGEIAIRVARACRELGISSVGVYSDADRAAPHLQHVDEAVPLGGVTAAESYLRSDLLIGAARLTGAEAVHPGYGFVAENADFADACAGAGLTFVGPPPSAMRALGSKTAARATMQAAGVPVVPGTIEPVASAADALRVAAEIGFPLALKAVSGGGGKGMRAIERPEDLESGFEQASSEALASFGDASLYIERLVRRPRHVEIQILADTHGNVIHLGERECSIQRRHQKLVEESPSPVVDAALRERMGAVAVTAARTVGYTNAGTCEFLLDQDGSFYFLEVNARLQVEHPVTEMVTGLDLVREQLAIAAGERLSLAQADVVQRGHAIECRVSAEDPLNRFFPAIGTVAAVREPNGPGVRLDGALVASMEVSLHYDPLLAKLIVWAPDRRAAIQRMRRALGEYLILGVATTIPFHRWLMEHPAFIAGDMDTGFIDRYWSADALDGDAGSLDAAVMAVLAHHGARARPSIVEREAGNRSDWVALGRRAGMRVG